VRPRGICSPAVVGNPYIADGGDPEENINLMIIIMVFAQA
jgi:hypothetical protein